MKKFLFNLLFAIVFTIFEVSPIYPQATFETGSMGVSINAYGRIRAYLPSVSSGVKQIERISPLVGVGPNAVFDYLNDMDNEQPTTLVSNPQLSDFEITGAYNNAYSAAPPNVLVRYNVYSWNNAKFTIVKWTFINRENSSMNAKIGLDVIMSLDGTYGYDTVTFDQSKQIIITHRGGVSSGIKILSHPLNSLISFEWFNGYNVDANYWNWLNNGAIQNEYVSSSDGPVTIPSIDFINIASGDSVTIYFAFALGENYNDLISQINEATNKYNVLVGIDEKYSNAPSVFNLEQNYPNPFNPKTTIKFSIASTDFVTLKIYDLLGNEVAVLVNDFLNAGNYSYELDASNLSSGIYFYKLKCGKFESSKKMVLIK